MKDDADLEPLFFKYFAAELTPEEWDRLQSALRERPELRRRFLQESIRVGAIQEWSAEQLIASTPTARNRGARRWIAVAAAAGVVALLMLLFRGSDRTPEVAVAPPAPKNPPKSPPVVPAPPREEPVPPPVVAPTPTAPPKEAPPVPAPPPKPEPVPEKPPVPPPPEPPPEPPKPPAPRSEVMVARIEETHGSAAIVRDGAETRAKRDAGVPAGSVLRTSGADAVLALLFADGTRVVLGGDTELGGLRTDGGIQLTLVRGVTALDVAPQPRLQPLQLRTAHGIVTVVGTSLTVRADAAQLRVDVEEGKVRLDTPQGRSVVVSKDQIVEAGTGREPAVKRLPPPDLASDLVGHWKFDEAGGNAALDSSSQRHHVTIDGAVRVKGKLGLALKFDGVDDFVRLPRAAPLDDLQEGDYTMAAWCSTAEVPRGGRFILMGKVGFHLGLAVDEENRFEMWHYLSTGPDGGLAHARSAPGQTPNEFHHLAGVVSRSRGTTQIFVDGRPAGLTRWTPGSAPRDYGGRGWTIGMARENNVPYSPASAILDDVRLYRRALSPRDVAALAGATFGASSRVR